MTGQPDRRRLATGTAFILFAILCLSILPPLIRVGLTDNVSPVHLLTFRLLIASVALWGFFGLTRPGLLRIDRRGLAACTAAAAADCFASLCYYYSLTHVATSITHVIFSLYPVVALLLLALRGERFSKLGVMGLGLALAGVYLLIGPGGNVNVLGALLALGAASGYATHLALTQWFLGDYDSRTVASYVLGLITLMLCCVSLFESQPLGSISPTGWVIIIITGLVSSALARLALFAGIRRIGSARTALMAPVETFLPVLWAVMFLGDRLSPIQWGAGALIVTAMMVVLRSKAKATPAVP
jgi:drug/metabolite transporter (DMT)-like permease